MKVIRSEALKRTMRKILVSLGIVAARITYRDATGRKRVRVVRFTK